MAEDGEGGTSFSVPDEAVAALRKFDGPIAVVAVVGLYRTGKSYLVNRIVGHQHGFTVGPTVNACTKGIWMWSEPVPFVNDRGEKLQLLVLDTEGIGGTKSSSDYDTRIFSLAVLLCSTLIYNSLGSIDESAISNLSFVANLSQHVQVKATQSADESSSATSSTATESTGALSSFFPSFMWVIRDFALELVDEDYNDITELEYLNNCLQQQDGFSSDVLEKNRIRKSLTNFFTRRDCATIVRPLDDETKLQQIDNEPYESLRPVFREQLEKMRARMLGQLTAKTLQGKTMSGSMFSTLTRTYVDAMNADGVPTITTAWEHVAKTETKAALARAVEIYEKMLSEVVGSGNLPMDETALMDEHKKMKHQVKSDFLASAVGDATETYLPKLKQKMQELYDDACRENERTSLSFCTELFTQLHQDNIACCLPNASDVSDADILNNNNAVRAKFEKMKDEYFNKGRGPRTNVVWQEKSTNATYTAYSAILAWEQEKKDAEIRAVEQRARDAESKLSTVAASEEVLRQELEESRKEGGSNEAETSMLQIKLSGQEQEVAMNKKQLEEANVKLKAAKDAEDRLRAEHEKEMDQIRLELQEERDRQPVVPAGQGGCGCVVQ
jgi:hypothetical protein